MSKRAALAVCSLSFVFIGCSSSNNTGSDAGVDGAGLADTGGEGDDGSGDDSTVGEEVPPAVTGCTQDQLAYAAGAACGSCAMQNCPSWLQACANCLICQSMLGANCAKCVATCGGRGGGPLPDAGTVSD
jgi:hypothetical protein